MASDAGGLVLALKGVFCGGEVLFELLPPSGVGCPFVSGLRLMLSGLLLGEPSAFQLSSGLGGSFPDAGGGGGPLFVAGIGNFELLAFGSELASQCLCVHGVALVVLGSGVGGLLPGVGFGLGGEAELAGDVRRGGGLGAVGVQDAGFEFAAGQAADVSIQGSWAERVMLSVGTMSLETTVVGVYQPGELIAERTRST